MNLLFNFNSLDIYYIKWATFVFRMIEWILYNIEHYIHWDGPALYNIEHYIHWDGPALYNIEHYIHWDGPALYNIEHYIHSDGWALYNIEHYIHWDGPALTCIVLSNSVKWHHFVDVPSRI
jgi:hypothetical protein